MLRLVSDNSAHVDNVIFPHGSAACHIDILQQLAAVSYGRIIFYYTPRSYLHVFTDA
jgi:hypothetical protein